MVKPVQKDLNAIAERVQASNRRWYKFILTGRTANPKIICTWNHLFFVCSCFRIQCIVYNLTYVFSLVIIFRLVVVGMGMWL
jgi:hypothetical protein